MLVYNAEYFSDEQVNVKESPKSENMVDQRKADSDVKLTSVAGGCSNTIASKNESNKISGGRVDEGCAFKSKRINEVNNIESSCERDGKSANLNSKCDGVPTNCDSLGSNTGCKARSDVSPTNNMSNETKEPNSVAKELKVRVKMIDFAHVLDAEGKRDEGYVIGLTSLLEFMKKLQSI